MDWFHSISLKKRFVGLLIVIVALSATIGFLLVKNIRSSSVMVERIGANNTRALYAKELQILLLRIESGFKNLSDLEEGIEDATVNMEIARQTIEFLREGQSGTAGAERGNSIDEHSSHNMAQASANHESDGGKGKSTAQVVDLGTYAASYESFYQKARTAAVQFAQSADADADDYFVKIEDYKESIGHETDNLMTKYVVAATQHAGHVNAMLGFTEKTSILLLSAQAGVIFLVTLLIMYGCNRALRNIHTVINKIIDQGWDLTLRLEQNGNDEFSQVAGMFNQFIERLRATLLQVRNSSSEIALAADNIRMGNDNLADRNAEQASSLEETASSMEEMTSIVQSNASNASEVSSLAETMREHAERGGNIISQTASAMGGISESSGKMAEIISVVDGISFQTNLLALNAAVEAARAGEQGRGFSVVAGEVRELAQRSADAAKEVKKLIEESTSRVMAGSDLVNRSGEVLGEIINSATDVHQIIARVAAASEEQAQGIEQVNNSVAQMDSMTQHNTHLVEEIANASQKMHEQTDRLREMVSLFTLGDGHDARASQIDLEETSRITNLERPVESSATKAIHIKKPVIVSSPDWESF